MRRAIRIAALLAIMVLAGLACQAALGYWSGGGNDGDGNGAAGAATVNQGAAPTVSESGSGNVVVSWGGSGLSNGVAVDGYIVKRYNAATGAQATIGAGCSGTITATTCTEPETPPGNWVYSETPVFSSNWRGAESVKSGAVNTESGSMTHSLSVRSNSSEASAGILVDNTPPTIKVTVDPLPNAAGWNKIAPVEVGGTVSDGDGSGVAFAKYTEDGSDPKTSATAQIATGPVSVSATTTLEFYLADNAGNQSPVETQQVKIDTTLPYFTVDFVDIAGGAYIEAADEETGDPGDAYYRGAAAGSFRFLMTPLALGGSPAVSAGFSELPSSAVGFSFDSSAVTTPAGGPFLSNPISWVAGTTSTAAGTISLTNEAGSTFGSTGPLHNDSTPPSGGSVDAIGLSGTGGRYSTTLNLSLGLDKGTDTGSGLADGTGPSDVPAQLLRASAPLSSNNGTENGTCGTYSAFTQVGGTNPVSPVSDTVPTNDRCYLYRYLVSDHVCNIATYASSDIKVQTAAPAVPEPLPVGLGEAGSFAVLGASTVTSAGVSALTGNLGVSPGTAITGFPPGTVNGTTHSADAAANQAQADLGVAYADAAGRAGAPVSGSLGGQTFTRGVYKAASFSLTGNLTLDAQNDPAAVFVFQAGSTLATTASSHINLINGAQACNVFWQVGSSAALGSSSTFTGNILAFTSISTAGGVAMNGRALAHNGAVTLIEDTIVAPQCAPPVGPAPTNAVLTPVSGTGAQSVSGSTIFYNPAQSGSFNVDSSANSSVSGVAQMTFPAITGFTGGGAVTSPFSGTNFRSTYSWSANGASPSPGAQPISATDNAGQASTNSAAFTVTKDAVSPSGGSVDATGLGGTGGRYSTSTTLSVAFEPGTDGGSGLAPSGAQLLRASAPLTSDSVANGSCGAFGPYTQVGANDPSTPRSDTVPADRTCYRYEYLVSDKVGNQTTYVSPDVKVDATSPPTPALSFSALVNAYWSGAGTQVFYRPGATSGGFQLIADSADTTAGTVGYGFPTFPSGWSASSGGSGIRNYSWSAASPTAPSGVRSVTTTNNAGGSAASSFTATPDATLPIGGSLSYSNGYTLGATVSVSFVKGTDTISGLNAASGIVEGSTATLSAGACGGFGPFSVLATNPASGGLLLGDQRRLLPIPLPGLRQRRQPDDLYERQRGQGRQRRPNRLAQSRRRGQRVAVRVDHLLPRQRRRLVQDRRRGHRRRLRPRLSNLPGDRDHGLGPQPGDDRRPHRRPLRLDRLQLDARTRQPDRQDRVQHRCRRQEQRQRLGPLRE
ncbi:MAG TPA: ice-binding family protein [Solirubrobacterales bacterium]|nr:ice-binding family protein [Solirubrobacterales bacterium]